MKRLLEEVCEIVPTIMDNGCEGNHLEVRDLLERIGKALKDNIFVAWHVSDVQVVRPDLDDEQCREVLDATRRRHDAAQGITWETLESQAERLYGELDDREPYHKMTNEQAREWLIEYDPEYAEEWKVSKAQDLVDVVGHTMRDFGEEGGWKYVDVGLGPALPT